jgi:hypothetical protein
MWLYGYSTLRCHCGLAGPQRHRERAQLYFHPSIPAVRVPSLFSSPRPRDARLLGDPGIEAERELVPYRPWRL